MNAEEKSMINPNSNIGTCEARVNFILSNIIVFLCTQILEALFAYI